VSVRRVRPGVAVIAAVCSCNAVFDIDHTQPAPPLDAAYFDAPADAPYACPATGVPRFSPYLHQVFTQYNCREYNESLDGFGVAVCIYPAQLVGRRLVTIPELSDPRGPFGEPRITPEGDALFVRKDDQLATFTRTPTGAWLQGPNVSVTAFTTGYGMTIGTPTMGSPRRLMVQTPDLVSHEIAVDAQGIGTEVQSYTPYQLAGTNALRSAPNLSPDGLRITFVAHTNTGLFAVHFATRPSIDVRFAGATTLPDLGGVNDPFLTGNCGHLFFSAVGSVAYVKQ
jgi:hypothetical protein